ncbi:hypothetical protein [Halorubrum ezzemoulense]|nr:hypothetical protein [Halorubrum ezzemoulense]
MSRPVVGNPDERARNENLPLPIVKYPNSSSCFIGFKERRGSQLYFCSCAETALKNYIRGRIDDLDDSHRDVTVENVVQLFQDEIKEDALSANLDNPEDVVEVFQFKDDLCHRCNEVVPKLRFCHEMYGTVFKQNYGWYINQKQYKYGFYGNIGTQKPFVEEIPDHIFEVIDDELENNFETKTQRLQELRSKRRERNREINDERKELLKKYADPDNPEFQPEDIDGDHIYEIKQEYNDKPRLPPDEAEELEQLEDLIDENWDRVSTAIENEVREEFGHHEIGSRWESETVLYNIIESKYGDEYTIKRHHRPDWLEGLELDIFIEEAGVGIEYQGIQHYEVVEAWGGEEGLEERQERDQQTKELCREHGVELVEVRYDEDISEEIVEKRVDSLL